MSPHRSPGERDERRDVEPLHRGPRSVCPGCSASAAYLCGSCGETGQAEWTRCERPGHGVFALKGTPCFGVLALVAQVTRPVFCSPADRVRVGWLRRCSLPGEHLHQHCTVCGARWICAVVEPVG